MSETASINFFALGRRPTQDELAALPPDTPIMMRHLTTWYDGGESLREFGLLGLRDALTKPTLLRRFLEEYGLHFEIDKKLLWVNQQPIPLFDCLENCASCLNDRTTCRLFDKAAKSALSPLYERIYDDKPEPTFYLYYTPDEEASLPGARHPMVLKLLDDLLTARGESAVLVEEWVRRCGGKVQRVEFYNIGEKIFLKK